MKQLRRDLALSERKLAQKACVTQLRQRLENETKHTAPMAQVQTLGEANRAKDELLALKDQIIYHLRSELFEGKSHINQAPRHTKDNVGTC